MKVQGRKVLVTGAGGFIGSHLVEALIARGAEVTAMVHYDARPSLSNLDDAGPDVLKKVRVLSGNVEDPFFMMHAVEGQEVVFHLAALIAIPYSYVAPASYVHTNIMGTLNVLEACKRHGVQRLVHTSTSETYGTALRVPIDEDQPLQGQSPYSASKIGADKLAESYHRSFNLPVATIRPFNTFGPRQSARAVIPTIISQALFTEQIRLGSLTPKRDLTFCTDTAAGFIAVAECDAAVGQVVNVGQGDTITIGELAKRVLKIMGVDKPIVADTDRVRPDASEVMTLFADRSKAEKLMGWKPTVSLDEGLGRTIDFIKATKDRFRPGHYER